MVNGYWPFPQNEGKFSKFKSDATPFTIATVTFISTEPTCAVTSAILAFIAVMFQFGSE